MKATSIKPDNPPSAFPFAAIVGMDSAREALLLLAIDRGLKGVLIAAATGMGKSVLVRSFASLVCDSPFVDVPSGAMSEHLYGGLDWQRTLATGRRQVEDGLLARAHHGFLHVDHVNHLDGASAQAIAGALATGALRVEREGLSDVIACEIALIGSFDPAESEPPAAIAGAVAMHVSEASEWSNDQRAQLLERVADYHRDPHGFTLRFAPETEALRRRIAQARTRLLSVSNTRRDIKRLSEAALRLGVEGNRADIFALRAARAHAALNGCTAVADADLDAAVRLVLFPLSRALPLDRPSEGASSEARTPGGESPRKADEQRKPERERQAEALGQQTRIGPQGATPQQGHFEERIFDAPVAAPLDFRMAGEILSLAQRGSLRKHAERSRRREKTSPEQSSMNRGRFVRAIARRGRTAKVALAATLRAAAPYQRERCERKAVSHGPLIQLAASDLRYKQYKQKAGTLVIFAVDSSGSMAANRIGLAKGVLLRLLEKSYLNRDKVALITFRGQGAELLLPPTQSVERAKRALDALPVGGGTPLAAGLEAALQLARRARPSDGANHLLVLVTDGTANVSRGSQSSSGPQSRVADEQLWHEIESVCALLRREGLQSVVIDTRPEHVSPGHGRRIAQLLGGRHVSLPRPGGRPAEDVLAGAVSRTKVSDRVP